MAQGKQSNINSQDQDYILAKIALVHYGILHDYLTIQMEKYTIACCNISLPSTFKIVPDEKMIVYDLVTEKSKPLPRKGWWYKVFKYRIPKKVYEQERAIAALNLRTWTMALLSGWVQTVKVYIDGTEQA